LETENGEGEFFGTETMAELCARQGRLAEALRIYRQLIESRPADERHATWTARYQSLQRAVGSARGGAPDQEAGERTSGKVLGKPDGRGEARRDGNGNPGREPPPVARADAEEARQGRGGAGDSDRTPVVQVMPFDQPPRAQVLIAPGQLRPGSSPAFDRAAWEALAQAAQVHRLPLLITQPVRSGQVVRAEKNDLIVMAPVNPGAQLVADGNIHVYGPLRGQAIAGAMGCAQARIFCQKLDAELVAINGIYLIHEDIPPGFLGGPAQVYLEDDRCLIDRL
jgi:septum formation inhibitor MinC